MTTVPLRGELHDLFSGVLHKVGGKIKSWTKRYFVLKSDYCLYYYKDTSKGALGVISLRDPKFKVRQGEASDISWPRQTKLQCTMAIVTTHRTYCVYCDYSHEIEEWIRMLTKAREKMIKINLGEKSGNKLLSGGRSSSSSTVETAAHENDQHVDKPRPASLFEHQGNYEPVYAIPPGEGGMNTASDDHAAITNSSNTGVPPQEGIYDLAKPETEIYEDISDIDQVPPDNHYTPLDGRKSEDVLYEDIPSEPSQPLYDSIALDKTSHRRDTGGGGSSSDDDGNVFPPSLPSRNIILPPLPSRNGAPQKNNVPPLPSKDDNVPPLPSKDDNVPSLPSKDESPPLTSKYDNAPPLPSKDESPPLSLKDESPPLPSKDESPPLSFKDESPVGFPLLPSKDNSPVLSNHHQSPQLTPPTVHQTPPTTPTQSRHPSESDVLPPTPTPRCRSTDVTPPTPRRSSPRSSLGSNSTDGGGDGKPSPLPRRKSPLPQPSASQQDRPVAKPRVRNVSEVCPDEHGMVRFKFQKERLKEFTHELDGPKKRSVTIHDVTADPTLSPTKRAIISETLREVEQEKLMASEEKYKWERERKKLEEERQMFEEEKRLLQEEIEHTRTELLKQQQKT